MRDKLSDQMQQQNIVDAKSAPIQMLHTCLYHILHQFQRVCREDSGVLRVVQPPLKKNISKGLHLGRFSIKEKAAQHRFVVSSSSKQVKIDITPSEILHGGEEVAK